MAKLVGPAHVQADRLETRHALVAELVVESLEDRVVPALAGPDDCAVAVVVGDDGQVPVSLAIGDLVDADPVEVVEPSVVDRPGHHVDHDLGHRLPADPEQLGDGRLVDVLGQPRHDVLEVPAVAGPGARPGDLLGAHPPAVPTVDPADLGLEEAPGRPEVEVSPPAHRSVVDRPGPPPARAAVLGAATAQSDHDPLGGKADTGHRSPADGQHLVE